MITAAKPASAKISSPASKASTTTKEGTPSRMARAKQTTAKTTASRGNAKKAADRGLELVTMDASSDYISAGGPLARKLYRHFPWAKIVIIVRDPLTRVLAKITKRNSDGSITYLCPEKRQLLGCVQDYLDAGDSKYVLGSGRDSLMDRRLGHLIIHSLINSRIHSFVHSLGPQVCGGN